VKFSSDTRVPFFNFRSSMNKYMLCICPFVPALTSTGTMFDAKPYLWDYSEVDPQMSSLDLSLTT
jgi:hypothetical protein